MTNKFNVTRGGICVGRAYVSPDQANPMNLVVSILPINRSGNWDDDNDSISLSVDNLPKKIFSSSITPLQAVSELAREVFPNSIELKITPIE